MSHATVRLLVPVIVLLIALQLATMPHVQAGRVHLSDSSQDFSKNHYVIHSDATLTVDECEGKDKGACDAADMCTWCTSAAVPSSCYTREQAKHLPSAVFKCDKPAPGALHPQSSTQSGDGSGDLAQLQAA